MNNDLLNSLNDLVDAAEEHASLALTLEAAMSADCSAAEVYVGTAHLLSSLLVMNSRKLQALFDAVKTAS